MVTCGLKLYIKSFMREFKFLSDNRAHGGEFLLGYSTRNSEVETQVHGFRVSVHNISLRLEYQGNSSMEQVAREIHYLICSYRDYESITQQNINNMRNYLNLQLGGWVHLGPSW